MEEVKVKKSGLAAGGFLHKVSTLRFAFPLRG